MAPPETGPSTSSGPLRAGAGQGAGRASRGFRLPASGLEFLRLSLNFALVRDRAGEVVNQQMDLRVGPRIQGRGRRPGPLTGSYRHLNV
uniref:small integral membrane protein 15 isoform X2 n=1 Tax=Nyctereutes procyonoides TaxID=34880 RepID=UPI002443D734|nr:small integral membrane protein 15 isoform X2 [Nyctereutes procyonoides]